MWVVGRHTPSCTLVESCVCGCGRSQLLPTWIESCCVCGGGRSQPFFHLPVL